MIELVLTHKIDKINIESASGIFDIDILRLDRMHPMVNGNKWFKLKYHFQEFEELKAKGIATFGGVWSNHIAATAAYCYAMNIPCKIYIRSDEHLQTATIETAMQQKASIEYISRAAYKELKKTYGVQDDGYYYIAEGGASSLGVKGASEILDFPTAAGYHKIFCALGTGTTFAGIVNASHPHQHIIGINALKGGFIQKNDIAHLIKKENYTIYNDFHFGGFAKYNAELIEFMNSLYNKHTIPADIIYTSKMFYAMTHLISTNQIDKTDKILMIHTGGLQGNQSLSPDLLNY